MTVSLKIGLTGNIGSGKSTVAEVFAVLGVPLYHADEASKKFLNDPAVTAEIARHFGPGIVSKGKADRKALASIVFQDAGALRFLNNLLHPRVRDDFRQWLTGQPDTPYVIHEAAILFESGFRKEFDRVIHVSCPPATAVERVVRRDRVETSRVLERMQHQWPDEKKSALADYVIVNDGTRAVIPQVLLLHGELMRAGQMLKDPVNNNS